MDGDELTGVLDMLCLADLADLVAQIGEIEVLWRRTEEGSYQAEIAPWSIVIEPPAQSDAEDRRWFVVATYSGGHLRDCWCSPSLREAMDRAEKHAEREYDFSEYERYGPELLAKILYNEGLLGIRWDETEPDTSDDRYRRCLVASRAALDGYWCEDTPLQPGEPLVTTAMSSRDIMDEVESFVFTKINEYHVALEEGISTPDYRRQCRRSRAAGRRATASLFGEAAMLEAVS